MKTITQYREDIKNLMKKAADIDAKCINENREISEAEISLKNEILDAVEELRKILATQERQERINAAMEAPASSVVSQPGVDKALIESRAKDRFSSFGEQLATVMHA